jgi:NAD(P)-dependent dehydrogenase (short-subunit alcohol dehydrogenase family)
MPFNVNLKEKVAFVTGASSGLGARFAKVLAASGANVVLAARRVDRLKELRAEIEAAGCAAYVTALDVTDGDSIKAAVDDAESHVGQIDILVNNSGVSTTQRLTDVTPADYEHVMSTNVRGAFFVAQEIGRRMIAHARANAGFRGRVINIASVAGLRVLPQIGLYCISKAAVVQMTKAQALEWGRYNINVNAICPGYIRTEINEDYWDTEGGQRLMQMLPRKRVGNAADLDALLLLLASDEAQFINGAVIAADDGLSVT